MGAWLPPLFRSGKKILHTGLPVCAQVRVSAGHHLACRRDCAQAGHCPFGAKAQIVVAELCLEVQSSVLVDIFDTSGVQRSMGKLNLGSVDGAHVQNRRAEDHDSDIAAIVPVVSCAYVAANPVVRATRAHVDARRDDRFNKAHRLKLFR